MSDDATAGPPSDEALTASSQPPRRRSLAWHAAIGIGISVVLLWFTFRNEDPREIAHEISRADPLLLALATAVVTFVFWIRAWRWRSILEPVRAGTSFRSRFAAVNIGFMGNNLLPARAGEFARAYAISRLEPVPIVAAFSSLVIERLFDGLLLVVLLFGSIAMPSFPDMRLAGSDFHVTAMARGLAFFVAFAALVLLLLVLFPQRAVRSLERVLSYAPAPIRRPVIDALEAFLAGVGILRDPVLLLRAGAWSVVLWLVNGLAFYIGFLAFDIDLPFTAAIFLQSCVALFVSLPAAPGFFGQFELASKIALVNVWGAEESKALGYALGFHIAGFIPVTVMGLFYAWRMGLSLKGMARTEEVVETAVERQTGIDPDDPTGKDQDR